MLKIPKLKAIELVDAMSLTYEVNGDYVYPETAKLCAIIAVNEIIASGCTLPSNNTYYGCNEEATEYYRKVIEEIKKL